MSWALHRVDDRLIHGQVVVAWGQRLDPDRIWVVDDDAASNEWERELLESAVPDVQIRVVGIAEGAEQYDDERAMPGKAFLLVRGLRQARSLVEAGASIDSWNLGGLHYAPGKTKVNEYVYLDDDDLSAARALHERGVELSVQDVPASRAQPLTALVPGLTR